MDKPIIVGDGEESDKVVQIACSRFKDESQQPLLCFFRDCLPKREDSILAFLVVQQSGYWQVMGAFEPLESASSRVVEGNWKIPSEGVQFDWMNVYDVIALDNETKEAKALFLLLA